MPISSKLIKVLLRDQFTKTLIDAIIHVDKEVSTGHDLEEIKKEMTASIIKLPLIKGSKTISDAFVALAMSYYEAGQKDEEPPTEDFNYLIGLIIDEVNLKGQRQIKIKPSKI